jgi:glycosyltransferase involved in cell wall biosynthesis
MRILFVAPTLPIPASGGRTRLFNLIRQLASRHEISVISFIQPSEHDMLRSAEPYCTHIELVPFEGFAPLGKWRNRLRGWSRILFSRRPGYACTFPVDRMRVPLRRLLSSQVFDVVAFHLYVVELADEVEDVATLLVEENIESDIARRACIQADNPVHWLRDWLTWRKLLRFEREWVRRFRVCVAVSQRDADRLRQMAPETELVVVPNGVDVEHFAPREGERDDNTLLFFGTLSYSPNADGLIWFCRNVLPEIRDVRPEVALEVVGHDLPRCVLDLDQLPGVHVTGFVPDIRTKLWSATACVVPLHVGGGTRLKILEALAAGCPVISTTVGAEGLELMDGEHLLIADHPEEFARDVVAVLESDGLRHRLAEAGMRAVAEKYDWQEIAPRLEAACIQAVQLHERN